ncbi:hypothetical protein [Algibacter luteus]|uniref:hypothetical protein n=1 Tax=Algibacter luteus TaxID=1178825 RepID=UPI0025951759|nr:hypothetical protein [Algibacter luteus]WJJ97869.1 hypothetical protein O5O44_05635 [Algibacter luteus]
MKKLITLFLTSIILISCGVSIKSVVDSSAIKEPYSNPLIVIPFEKNSTRNFSEKLEEKLEIEFNNDNKKVEFLLVEQGSQKLALNQNDDVNSKIDNAVRTDQKDIVLIFKPTNLSYYNGGLQSATYQLTGIDVTTKKEVWKATFNSNSSFGPALFAEKSAKTIFEKLKTDKVL